MTCPHCHEPLPEQSTGGCPHCGGAVEVQPVDTWPNSPLGMEPPNWPAFFIVLLAPPFCCFLCLIADAHLLTLFAILGGLMTSLWCARMLMKTVRASGLKRKFIYLALALLCCGLTMGLCFIGCTCGDDVASRRH